MILRGVIYELCPLSFSKVQQAESIYPHVYEVFDGCHRLFAFKKLNAQHPHGGYGTVPTKVVIADSHDLLIKGLLNGNNQRTVSPLELAKIFAIMREKDGMSQAEIGRLVNRSQSAVSVHLALLTMPEWLRLAVHEILLPFTEASALKAICEEQGQKILAQLRTLPEAQRRDMINHLLDTQNPSQARDRTAENGLCPRCGERLRVLTLNEGGKTFACGVCGAAQSSPASGSPAWPPQKGLTTPPHEWQRAATGNQGVTHARPRSPF